MSGIPGPYPISSNSRTKLNAFRYNEPRDDQAQEQSPTKAPLKPAHDNKENQNSWANGVVEPTQLHSANGKQSARTDAKSIKECPQTPASNRIPLADLISNTEDAFSLAPGQEFTPDDHVIWQHVPASSNQDPTSQTPGTRRKRKRHGSSPGSSPLANGSKDTSKQTFDLQTIQSLLKTPQHDLATDLWNNYVGKSTVNENGELPPPRFANLLSSSPQTPGSALASRDSSGLRRSISCNAEWPTSKAKRRRLAKGDMDSGRSLFSRSTSNVLDSGRSKSSKINFLLERIERSLQNPQPTEADALSSLSPLPARTSLVRSQSMSPTKQRMEPPAKQEVSERDTSPKEIKYAKNETKMCPQESSSEFGDDDLDNDFLELAQSSMDPFTELETRNNRELAASKGSSVTYSHTSHLNGRLLQSGHETKKPVSRNDKKTPTISFNDDEFDDEFSENLADIMTGFDESHGSPKPSRAITRPAIGTGKNMPNIDDCSTAMAKKSEDNVSSDEFDDDDFDLEAIEQSMVQSAEEGLNKKLRSRQAIKRYLIVDTKESMYVTHKGRTQAEQVLFVQEEKTKLQKVIILRESWFDSPCSKDSYIHLIGDFDAAGKCIVSDSSNMIILHPDHLISATVVADSISCQRRAVLQDRIKAIGDLGKPQVFGNIFHEVFQEAMKANQWDLDSLRSLVESIVQRHIEDLYVIQMTVPQAIEYVMDKIPEVKAWADVFLQAKPTARSVVEDRNNSQLSLSINKLLEVEEHIWSPMYGLKGNIDATVQISCKDEGEDKTLVVPLELKTGKRDTNQAHRAQTALYTLLMTDRYDVDVTFGLLYYLELSKTIRIRGIRHELLQMIQVRNRLAGYVRERFKLPPMIKKPRMCNQCYAKTSCFVYHKLADDGDGETSGLGDDFTKMVDHLNPKHRDFFRKWDELLTKEEQSMMRFRRELWTLVSSEREALGRCFGNVVIEQGSAHEDKHASLLSSHRSR
ncbi:hypothetical protein ASPZODRAFT_1467390 [Penicilliopsis zonata CBS 506.65]|uniref:DNA helicase n=1 Tax=Penicilliopsis zonata CBS 506.65 TaxID=1073090 RepID=A0A1L9SQ37_9EURO|nr:hypothetical protein ASPZODRAFT_1467390 [Penicilliopsis zonata CBS 506.65]OJJ49372.1 hypothetical protein ASPZODRAFT_1467390 [Penicilliopsis zonata CBS 506.65]